MLVNLAMAVLVVAAPPRPTRDGLLIVADWGCIVEQDQTPDVGDHGPSCRIDEVVAHWDWFDTTPVAQVWEWGHCGEYPDILPVPGTFEALVAGTLTIHEFIAINPGIQLGSVAGAWTWSNDRRECFAGRTPPPWHEIAPAYVLRRHTVQFWAGVECEAAPVLVRCSSGAAFSWSYRGGCGNTVQPGSTPGFSPCDADFDGDSDIDDWGIFVSASGWDWDGSGATDIRDIRGFQLCLWP